MTHKKYTEEYFQSKSKDELVKMLTEHLNCKKYGLVWEDTPEKIDSKNIYPLLNHNKELSLDLIQDKPMNYLIEGDNYHSLKVLQKTHLGKIDVIYIDPPYNTGNEFVYNDKLIDKEDNFRHSKWLSFMGKRLNLAKNLLSEDGVIFISIDDNEQAQLKLLMDEIFGEYNYIQKIVRVTKRGGNKGRFFSPTYDEILVYGKNKSNVSEFGKKPDDTIISRYNKEDEDGRYQLRNLHSSGLDVRPNQRYWVKCPDGTYAIPRGTKYPSVDKGCLVEPSNKDNIFTWSYERYLEELSKGNIVIKKVKNSQLINEQGDKSEWNVYRKLYLDSDYRVLPENIVQSFLNSKGKGDVTKIGVEFTYPKPVELVKYLIDITNKGRNITVLDFFAGSGTTGHAVMELNKEDGGNRSFILCTNNEVSDEKERTYLYEQGLIPKNNKTEFNKYKKNNPEEYQEFLKSEEYQQLGIARSVTRERLKRVIEGYTTPKGVEVEGLPNNLIYLKTDEIDKESLLLDSTLPLAVKDTLNLIYPPTTHKIHIIDILTNIDKLNLDKEKDNVFIIDSKDEETISMLSNKLLKVFGRDTIIEIMSKYL